MAWHDFIPAFNKYQWGALVEENEREQVEIPVQSQKTSAQSLFLGFEHAGRNFYLEIFFDGKDHPRKAVLNVFEGKKMIASDSGSLPDIMSLLFSNCR